MKYYIFKPGFLMLATVLLLAITQLSSCKKDAETPLKIGLVTGIGKLFDKGFSEQAYYAVKEAAGDIGADWEVKECSSAADIANNIKYFTDKNFNIIITLGYDASEATHAAATAYPNTKFLMLDYSPGTLPANMSCVVFAVDQASFPCGFLAAFRAFQQNALAPKVGYVAGPKIPPIEQFTTSFTAGVNYFNTRYAKNVGISGVNAAIFTDTILGAHLADSLIQQGAEVIFACAGITGNGALSQVKTLGKSAIGVDTDQYLTIPGVGSILLTSCMKNLRSGILNGIQSINDGTFQGGTTLTSNLSEKGVDLAPYHDFESQIPDSIKSAVNDIKAMIINGSLQTGWPK